MRDRASGKRDQIDSSKRGAPELNQSRAVRSDVFKAQASRMHRGIGRQGEEKFGCCEGRGRGGVGIRGKYE